MNDVNYFTFTVQFECDVNSIGQTTVPWTILCIENLTQFNHLAISYACLLALQFTFTDVLIQGRDRASLVYAVFSYQFDNFASTKFEFQVEM